MTVVERLGRLEFTFQDANGNTRRESITGIVPGAADQDVYDVGTAIAGLINDNLVNLTRLIHKDYQA